ncbi:DUF6053 domain-containing protein [Lysobacter enzymogenes]|uniref:DUF6053 domain-containing protein n=1 Tax=Lysobacter enzymogenes TaxID=69 RepID=UPI003D2F6217
MSRGRCRRHPAVVGGTSVPTLSGPLAAILAESVGTEVPPTRGPDAGADARAPRSAAFEQRDFLFGQHLPHLRRRGALHRFLVDVGQRRLAQHVQRQHGQVEAQFLGAEHPDREVLGALAVQAQAALAGLGRDVVLFEEARDRFEIVAVQVQRDRAARVGGALEHRADQARFEAGEELHRPQRGLAALAQAVGVLALEQALVLAQRVLDLAVGRQRGVVEDAEPLGGLELGLVVVAVAAFGHQPGRLVGDAPAALAGAGLRMLVCVLSGLVHLDLRAGTSRRGSSPRPGCTGSPKLARPRGAAMSAPGRVARRQIGQAGGVQAVVAGPSGRMLLFLIAAT